MASVAATVELSGITDDPAAAPPYAQVAHDLDVTSFRAFFLVTLVALVRGLRADVAYYEPTLQLVELAAREALSAAPDESRSWRLRDCVHIDPATLTADVPIAMHLLAAGVPYATDRRAPYGDHVNVAYLDGGDARKPWVNIQSPNPLSACLTTLALFEHAVLARRTSFDAEVRPLAGAVLALVDDISASSPTGPPNFKQATALAQHAARIATDAT